MNIYYANTIAQNYLRELQPYCVPGFIHIAGSVRRKKEDVGDIEIVCLPVVYKKEQTDLFGDVIKEITSVHPQFEAIVKSMGEVIKGRLQGRYMQIKTCHNIHGTKYEINVDLFMPRAADYWRQFAIRTGSSAFAHKFLAGKWVAKGWCGVSGELRLQRECYQVIGADGKPVWRLKTDIDKPTLPPVWQSEREFFQWLGLNWFQWENPAHRNL